MKMRVTAQRGDSEGARDARSTTSSDEAPNLLSNVAGLSPGVYDTTGGMCIYCQTESGNLIPLLNGNSHVGLTAHLSCRSSRGCAICGVPGLTFECEREGCLSVAHRWCLQALGFTESLAFLCPAHSTRHRGDKSTFFPTAQLLDRPTAVKDFKHGDSHFCTGTVFWYAFCTQFYPFFDQPRLFPNFEVCLDTCDDLEASNWDEDRERLCKSERPIDCLMEDLARELSSVQSTVREMEEAVNWEKNSKDESDGYFFASVLGQFAIHKQMKAKTTDDDWVLKDIKMLQFKLSNKDYLKYFEERERVIVPEPQGQSRCARSLEPPKCEEDIVCCVCGDGDYEEDNLIVICEAYGKEGACRLPCVLCPNNGGGLKVTLHPNDGVLGEYPKYDPSMPDTVDNPKMLWCHVFCAQRMPSSLVRDKPHVSGIWLGNVDPHRFKQKCEVCNTRRGACLQCSHKKCSLAFHPECGKSFFLFAREKTGDEGGVFCGQHRTLKLRQFLEHKEKKQVDEITLFFRKWEAWNSRQGRKRRRDLEFSSEESLQLIEVLDEFLSRHNASHSGSFELTIPTKPGPQRKVTVKMPPIYHLLDPNILTDKDLHIPGRTAEECKQYYCDSLFHRLKSEQELVSKPVSVLFSNTKPQRKAKKHDKKIGRPKRVIVALQRKQRKIATASINLFPIFLPPAKPKETTEVFCVCRQPFIEELPRLVGETDEEYEKKVRESSMISCEQCEEWYHLGCVGYTLSPEEAEKDDNWRCHECRLTANVKFDIY